MTPLSWAKCPLSFARDLRPEFYRNLQCSLKNIASGFLKSSSFWECISQKFAFSVRFAKTLAYLRNKRFFKTSGKFLLTNLHCTKVVQTCSQKMNLAFLVAHGMDIALKFLNPIFGFSVNTKRRLCIVLIRNQCLFTAKTY